MDDRCNREIIRKIEREGGEVSLAPASELFTYTVFINYQEACAAFKTKKSLINFLMKTGYSFVNRLALRDEKRLESIVGEYLGGLEEPSPEEIRNHAQKYVSKHYGGEPPMTIGRACALAGHNGVSGAILLRVYPCPVP